jgi:predicted nucleotidyltransferase
VREKVERHVSGRRVVYDEGRWAILDELRERATSVQQVIPGDSLVYGSVARGDVTPASDVDVVVLDPVPSYAIELALCDGFNIAERRLTIASPNSVPKANIQLTDGTNVSWSLLQQREREEGFYRFGGAVDARTVPHGERVPGVSKRLLLIEPGPEGHTETSVIGAEVEASSVLGLSLDVVEERVRVLSRRDRIGRTGVFRTLVVEEGRTFEQELASLSDTTPAVRRQMRYRGGP